MSLSLCLTVTVTVIVIVIVIATVIVIVTAIVTVTVIIIVTEITNKKSYETIETLFNPLVPRVKKVKIRQFNFKLTFTGLICKRNISY